MTTPQNELYRLVQRIEHLTDLFESDDNGDNIFDTIRELREQMDDIMTAQQRIENLLDLIVKLLRDHD